MKKIAKVAGLTAAGLAGLAAIYKAYKHAKHTGALDRGVTSVRNTLGIQRAAPTSFQGEGVPVKPFGVDIQMEPMPGGARKKKRKIVVVASKRKRNVKVIAGLTTAAGLSGLAAYALHRRAKRKQEMYNVPVLPKHRPSTGGARKRRRKNKKRS